MWPSTPANKCHSITYEHGCIAKQLETLLKRFMYPFVKINLDLVHSVLEQRKFFILHIYISSTGCSHGHCYLAPLGGAAVNKDVDSVGEKKFTRARRKESVRNTIPQLSQTMWPSPITPLIGRGSNFLCLNPIGRSEGSKKWCRSTRRGTTRCTRMGAATSYQMFTQAC